jgi:membrane associated rhomboid family serine protease
MIVPWLRGILGWDEAPLTWTLVGLNLLFYFLTAHAPDDVLNLGKKELLWAGRYYSELIGKEVPSDSNELLLRGTQALRDQRFYAALPTFAKNGDDVGFEQWKNRVLEFQTQLEHRPVSTFGLRGGTAHPFSWITYQFMHSGGWHVVGNLLMLIIFGVALERLTGSFMVVFVYLVGGAAGAGLFLVLNPTTTAPMVGASASLSAIMAFYALMERRRRVRFFFFLSPSPGYWGELYLPTLLILPLYFIEDLASYLSTAEEIGSGVAYTAHLGGALFGLFLALTLRQACARSPQWERILYASYSQSRNEAP